MKNIVLWLGIIVGLYSCTDDFLEMNTNPNQQTKASNANLLIGAQTSLGTQILESNEEGFGKWVQFYNYRTRFNSPFAFTSNSADVDIFWIYQYVHVQALRNIEEIFRNTDVSSGGVKHDNYRAVAHILKSWAYLYLTDLLGPIPYFESTKGDMLPIDESMFRPKFDNQEAIYLSINDSLKLANQMIIVNGTDDEKIDATSDIYANGDMLLWKKFCNSLRARMLLNMSDVKPDIAKKELTELFGDPVKYPVLTKKEENFGLIWRGAPAAPYANPIAESYRLYEYTWPAASGLINLLGELEDPRMMVYYSPTKTSVTANDAMYVGTPPAIDTEIYQTIKNDEVSWVNKNLATYAQKKNIITYSELMFIRAEAIFKGLIPGNAEESYNEAVKVALDQYDLALESNSYLANPRVKWNSSNGLELIITQKYISMFFQAREIFRDIRRTGYPSMEYYHIGNSPTDVAKGYPEKHMYPGSFETRREEYFAALGVNENSLWGTKLWFASKRSINVGERSNQAPTSLTGWKITAGGFQKVEIPYVSK